MDTLVENQASLEQIKVNENYQKLLNFLKRNVRRSRLRAVMSINHELIMMYWNTGKQILEKQAVHNWGSKLIDNLSMELRNAFPETKGFSVSNIYRMVRLAKEYPDLEATYQPVAQLPWGHISLLIQRIADKIERNWYAEQVIINGWSRSYLDQNIGDGLYLNKEAARNDSTNFYDKLSKPHINLAQEMIHNPYNLDFLGLHDDVKERNIEHASVKHITKFMLETGKGFAFVGSQIPITINKTEFFMDMLFYNLELRCYVVVEFKATSFKSFHVEQLNFYLSAIDDSLNHENDGCSIGILICKPKDEITVKYLLRDLKKAPGVSEDMLTKAIPKKLQKHLPSIEEIEHELQGNT